MRGRRLILDEPGKAAQVVSEGEGAPDARRSGPATGTNIGASEKIHLLKNGS